MRPLSLDLLPFLSFRPPLPLISLSVSLNLYLSPPLFAPPSLPPSLSLSRHSAQFAFICAGINDANERVELPPPAILKPIQLWTGKQLFSVIFRPNADVANEKQANAGRLWPVLNVELKSKNYNEEEGRLAMDAKDGYIVIRNSQLLCGNLCKNAMGGTKGGVLFVLIRDHGCAACAVCCVFG
jgi:hypothetical protein